MLALLRPHPHRGDIVAAGVVVLTLFTVLVLARFGGEWGETTRLLVVAAAALPVTVMAVLADAGDGLPRPYEAVLHVASFLLLVLTLALTADVLGSEGGPGTVAWVGTVLTLYALWLAHARNSAIMTLLAGLTLVVVVIDLVDLVAGIESITPVEWILFISAVVFTLGAVHQRDARRRHAVSLVDAAGLTILALGFAVFAEQVIEQVFSAIGASFLGEGGEPELVLTGGPIGWELVLLAFGFGLIAYGCVDRERVPPFLGILVLLTYLAQAFWPGEDGPSLIGWPIVLLAIAVALLAIGLRPRRELPPEPPVPHA